MASDQQRWATSRPLAAALLAALPVLLEPATRWLAAGLGLGNVPWIAFQWPLDDGGVTAEFAELAVGWLLTCTTIVFAARDRRLRGLAAGRSHGEQY